MAKSTIKFHCGCGYTTDKYLEAALHVDSTGHTLDVLGRIQPDNTSLNLVREIALGHGGQALISKEK